MISRVQGLNRVMLLACAPFLGMMIYLLFATFPVQLPSVYTEAATSTFELESSSLQEKLVTANLEAVQTKSIIERFHQLYQQSTADVGQMLTVAADSLLRPGVIYDERITSKLGRVTRHASSANIDLKLFPFQENNYHGYAMKVTLKSDKAMRLTLGKDKLGSSETTLEAARRYGAFAGVNAGGFADEGSTGKRFPLETTMIGGKYVYGFFPSYDNLTFIGLNKERKLIGGTFGSQAELDSKNPLFGATFVPTLLKNGQKTTIPSKWQTTPARAARTVVGNYKDDQLVFIVTDGNDESGRSGATLAELQNKLQELGVRDAYNLDGGGSSTLIFAGEVINRPSDGKMRPLATNFLFFK
ncbi:phosphodiester glycosidase family protein [Paenibacillus sp. N1-5-1-14]|uniref:phosphodiester glycosidase family protein n=1 Tax=Paenibacillus radicibacter TaxID=2972488 RepID=UPI00215952B3|nr:phosphodiester glycosidase family protein [Paenibacillus radicibacter]MCR8644820.1 phosphodiester glycosidase family protein [Paenibacillus radicibacter]